MIEETRLEVVVHMVDGNTLKFFTDEVEEIDRIVKSVQPNRLFTLKQIMMAGTYYMAGFQTDEITHLELITTDLPNWTLPGGIKELIEIPEEALDRRAMPRVTDARRSDIQIVPGGIAEIFTEFGLGSGRRVCAKMLLQVQGAIDQRNSLVQLFNTQGFHVNRRGGGVIIVNTRHITRWAMYPGPANAPTTAWRVSRLDENDWAGAPSRLVDKLELAQEDESDSDIPSKIIVGGGADYVPRPPVSLANQPAARAPEPPAPAAEVEEQASTNPGFSPIPSTSPLADFVNPGKPQRRVLKFGKKE